MTIQMKKYVGIAAALIAGATLMTAAAPAMARVDLNINLGTPEAVYVHPAPVYRVAQPVYQVHQPVYARPVPVYSDRNDHRWQQRHWQGRSEHGRNGRNVRHDQDRDGIADRYDRDRDGDGVANRHDRRPANPNRY